MDIMTPEAQKLAIAHAAGWREAFPKAGPPHRDTQRGGILLPYRWVNERTHQREYNLPDYLRDLNAMHEAEKVLPDLQQGEYAHELLRLVAIRKPYNPKSMEWCHLDFFQVAHATAAQRAEAFLRTLNLWID